MTDTTQTVKLVRDSRDHLNVVFLGHVDAGKSTLGGQVLYQSGMVDERTIEKYSREAKEKNRESWYLAFIMDQSEEERARGKTVHAARAYFETEKKRYTIIDAPGHRAYVPNMIGGASQADVGVLVISARKGEFEAGFEQGGQTKEHAMLSKILGIDRMIIVVNKMDEPTVNWSEERFNEIQTKLLPYLKKVGHNPKLIQFIPISGYTGANIKTPVDSKACPWYKGSTLLGALDAIESFDRRLDKPFRMSVMDRYKDRGSIVAMGKIESGKVFMGDKLLVMPSMKEVEVQYIRAHDMDCDDAFSGENVEMYLKSENEDDIQIGHVLCSPSSPVAPVKEFLAHLVILEKPMLAAGYKAVIHIHNITCPVTIVELLEKVDRKTGKAAERKPRFGKSGDLLLVRMQLEQSVCLTKFEDLPQLGRFTIREDKTVAVGKVIRFKPEYVTYPSNIFSEITRSAVSEAGFYDIDFFYKFHKQHNVAVEEILDNLSHYAKAKTLKLNFFQKLLRGAYNNSLQAKDVKILFDKHVANQITVPDLFKMIEKDYNATRTPGY